MTGVVTFINYCVMDSIPFVKISPCMSQKQLRFGDDVGVCNFMKFAKKYHRQVKAECANISRLTVCATSPPLMQTLAEYCRKTT